MTDSTPARLRYEQIAERIERQITSGVLAPGERIPSLRSMSRGAGVSVGTVVQAYLHLERRGLLEAAPRSGYFVSQAAQPELALPRRKRAGPTRSRHISTKVIDTMLDSLRRTDLIAFNSAVAHGAARINGRLNGLARRVLRERPDNANQFITPPGHLGLRREIAKRLTLNGAETEAGDVVITNGTMEAITLALGTLCRAGDTVLVESPTYFGILQAIEHLRLKIVEVRNHAATGIDADALETLLGKVPIAAAVLQSSFNNPTGALTSDTDKRRIVGMLSDAAIPIIEDDIYGDLGYGSQRPRPLAAFDTAGLVVSCGSISKTLALGYRIGWAVSPRHAAALSRAKFFSSVACPTLQQHVLHAYFASGVHDRHLRRVREGLAGNCQRLREAVAQSFPAGTRVTNPAGGVALWVELPNGADGVELFAKALSAGIGIAPGIIFSGHGDYGNFIRLSAGIEWSEDVAGALQRLGRLASKAQRRRRD